MDATLKLSDLTLAFGDRSTATSPQKKFFDWQVDATVSVSNPKSEPYSVPAGQSLLLFSGVRTILADVTTEWMISLSSLASDRYRFTNSAGTAPGLRTARAVDLDAQTAVWTSNANLTATLVSDVGSFSVAQVDDILFVPGTSTGDVAGPFSSSNEGYWIIMSISANGSTVQLGRPTGTAFTAATETAALTDPDQIQVFSSAGVQVGDGVTVSAGFATAVLKSYNVVAVNPYWFEVVSTSPLPVAATAIPGVSGIQFYSSAKCYVEMYADQECVLRLNGDTSDANRISPWQAGDINQLGRYVKSGPAWSATVVNKSQQELSVYLITAEPA